MLRSILQKRASKILSIAQSQTCRLMSTSTSDDNVVDNERDPVRNERGLNRVQLIGRVGRDPELRGTQERPCYIFPLATNELFTNKMTGERIQRTDWHRIFVSKPYLLEKTERLIKKGDRIYVEGSIKYNRYTDESGSVNTIPSIHTDDLFFLKRAQSREEGGEDL